MIKYLAVDYGKKRIGLALGAVFPRAAGVIDGALKREEVFLRIKEICRQNEVFGLVLGLPIRSRGEEGTLAQEIRDFAAGLEKATGLPAFFEPEEFTSVEAYEYLRTYHKKYDKSRLDEAAAALILERFLERKKSGNG